jgi:hypothetical protein
MMHSVEFKSNKRQTFSEIRSIKDDEKKIRNVLGIEREEKQNDIKKNEGHLLFLAAFASQLWLSIKVMTTTTKSVGVRTVNTCIVMMVKVNECVGGNRSK